MFKIGEFIYPWGGGHYSRMMRFDRALARQIGDAEIHYASKGHVYEKLLRRFPDKTDRIHQILMPTPIDGSMGPSLTKSLANLLLPVEQNRSLVRQVTDYLRQERRLYDKDRRFDLVVNDGDMGSNILAKNRRVPSLFVTNQFKPKLYRTRAYLYPALRFIAKQIAKATKILVADSPPPHTICEYNLNFTDEVAAKKVEYVGHFTDVVAETETNDRGPASTDLGRLIGSDDSEFGYWMRTGDKSTNDGTGLRYQRAFADGKMAERRRLVSHARNDPGIDAVTDRNGKRYSVAEAADKKIDWVQIDVGFLSEHDKDMVLDRCAYAVVNGSHTVMGEIMGGRARPIIGVPIYDEHTNNIRWADEHGLGILATSTEQIVAGIDKIMQEKHGFLDRLAEFSRNFKAGGAERTAEIAAEILQQ